MILFDFKVPSQTVMESLDNRLLPEIIRIWQLLNHIIILCCLMWIKQGWSHTMLFPDLSFWELDKGGVIWRCSVTWVFENQTRVESYNVAPWPEFLRIRQRRSHEFSRIRQQSSSLMMLWDLLFQNSTNPHNMTPGFYHDPCVVLLKLTRRAGGFSVRQGNRLVTKRTLWSRQFQTVVTLSITRGQESN